MPQQPRLDLRPGVSEPVVLLISRWKVEADDIASVLSRLKPFLAAREDAWRYRGQMTLVVDVVIWLIFCGATLNPRPRSIRNQHGPIHTDFTRFSRDPLWA